jgi:hypothetical protein
MDQDNWIAGAMVFVVKVEVARIFLSDCYVGHCISPSRAMNQFVIAALRDGKMRHFIGKRPLHFGTGLPMSAPA